MDLAQICQIVRQSSKGAVEHYLRMCHLDSPWEIPEYYMVAKSAEALAMNGLRVALEHELDLAKEAAPGKHESIAARLRQKHARVDLAVLRPSANPWDLVIEGALEFKKHASLQDDAELIQHLIEKAPRVNFGVLVLLLVGASETAIEDQRKKWGNLGPFWTVADEPECRLCSPLGGDKVKDCWWDVRCFISVRQNAS